MAVQIGLSGILEESRCVLCGAVQETTKQLMLEGMVSQIIWTNSPRGLNIRSFLDGPLSLWLKLIIDPSSSSELPLEDYHYFQLYALNSWDLIWWSTRNQIIHNDAQLNILQLINHIKKLCGEHVSAWHQKRVEKSSRWVPPKPRVFKANFDVAVCDEFVVWGSCD